jgi:hypothetical protein
MTNKTYKGYTEDQYRKAMADYAKAMFALFDSDKSYNSNKGSSLMWLGSFTASLIGRDVVDRSIREKTSLAIALVDELITISEERKEDLLKIKNLMIA